MARARKSRGGNAEKPSQIARRIATEKLKQGRDLSEESTSALVRAIEIVTSVEGQRTGGQASKRKPGMDEATRLAMRETGSESARVLWRWLKSKTTPNHPLRFRTERQEGEADLVYEVYIEEGELEKDELLTQETYRVDAFGRYELPDRTHTITYSTFRAYPSALT